MTRSVFAVLALCGMLWVSAASATTVDLTLGSAGDGSINGALFQWTSEQPTGTGVIQPFVRIQANGSEQGYNTDAVPVPFDGKPGLWTHSLLLSAVPVVNVGGTDYLQFLLDINQVGSQDNHYLTMNAFQIYLGATGAQDTTTVSELGTLIYDMGAGNKVELDYNLNPGSGGGDMFAYVPTSLIIGENPFLYLYSAFGAPGYASNDGFEEWAVIGEPAPPPIPEPGTIMLLGIGFLSLAIYGKRRSNA